MTGAKGREKSHSCSNGSSGGGSAQFRPLLTVTGVCHWSRARRPQASNV